MKDKELKLDETEASHTVGGGIKYTVTRRTQSTSAGLLFIMNR
jgi:hypothetical protein